MAKTTVEERERVRERYGDWTFFRDDEESNVTVGDLLDDLEAAERELVEQREISTNLVRILMNAQAVLLGIKELPEGGFNFDDLPKLAAAQKERADELEEALQFAYGFVGHKTEDAIKEARARPANRGAAQMSDEQLVREAWGAKLVKEERFHPAKDGTWFDYTVLAQDGTHLISCATSDEAWHAAAEFTRQRQEEIRQLEREMLVVRQQTALFCACAMKGLDGTDNARDATTFMRLLARLKSIKAELTKGMKQPAREVK